MVEAIFCSQCGGPAKATDTECSFCGVGFKTGESVPPLKIEILKDMKSGIPSQIFRATIKAFESLEIFESVSNMRAFFTIDSIKPFRNSLPEGNNISARVMGVIAYLSHVTRATLNDGTWYDGQNLLLITILEIYAYLNSKKILTTEFMNLVTVLKEEGYIQ